VFSDALDQQVPPKAAAAVVEEPEELSKIDVPEEGEEGEEAAGEWCTLGKLGGSGADGIRVLWAKRGSPSKVQGRPGFVAVVCHVNHAGMLVAIWQRILAS